MKDILVVQAGSDPLGMIVGKFDKVEDARKFINDKRDAKKPTEALYHIIKHIDSVRVKKVVNTVAVGQTVEFDIVDPEALVTEAKNQAEVLARSYIGKANPNNVPMFTDEPTTDLPADFGKVK